MKASQFEQLVKHKSKSFSDQRQRITYSFNEVPVTITGVMEEDGNIICLYEYRGKYIGTEFLISFAKDSISYKLLEIVDDHEDLSN